MQIRGFIGQFLDTIKRGGMLVFSHYKRAALSRVMTVKSLRCLADKFSYLKIDILISGLLGSSQKITVIAVRVNP